MQKHQSIRGKLAVDKPDEFHQQMRLLLKERFEEKNGCCFEFSKEKKCSCLMERCINSDEKRELMTKLMFSIIELKYNEPAKYERYILSQLNLRVKGNYSNGEIDKYSIPMVYSVGNVAGEQEIWICKGFWCFLTGVRNNKEFQALHERHRQLNADHPSNEDCRRTLEQIIQAEDLSIETIDEATEDLDIFMTQISFSSDE